MTTPMFYRWLEIQAQRGAQEIGSALFDCLEKKKESWPSSTMKLRLFCDGCPGQNKNKHIVHTLTFWLQNHAPPNLQKIIIYFPIRGHSFLPADRLFGRAEKVFKKKKEILLPEGYDITYAELGSVHILNEDWKVRSYKDLSEYMRPLKGIKEMRRIVLTKSGKGSVGFKMEVAYNVNDDSKKFVSIMNKSAPPLSRIILPRVLDRLRPLSEDKRIDIESLLIKRFGENWEEDRDDIGSFYSEILKSFDVDENSSAEEDSDCECDCLAEEPCRH